MGYARDAAGNIWMTDAQGNATSLVRSAGGATQAVPSNPLKVQQAQGDIGKTAVDTVRTSVQTQGDQFDNTIKGATTQAAIDKIRADALKAQAEATAAAAAAADKPNPAVAAQSKALGVDEVLSAIDKARGNVSGWSTGLGGQILQPIGGTQARDLSGNLTTIGSGLTVDKLAQMKSQSATGASGMGALSEKEGALLRDSVSSLDQAQSEKSVRDSLDAIEMHYRRLRAIQAGQNPDDPNVQQQFGMPIAGQRAPMVGGSGGGPGAPGGPAAADPSAPGGGGPTPMNLANGGFKQEFDPARKGLNARVSSMIGSGASADAIRQFLTGVGVDPAGVRGIDEAVAYRRKFPSYKGGYGVDVESPYKPLGVVGDAVNKMGQSGLGAYAANAADALTAGNLDSMTGNPALTRAGMAAVSDTHPGPSMLGTMTGGALAATGLEGGAAALGMKALPAAMAADATFGGLYGAGSSDDGDRLSGAAKGALIGLGGGIFGRGVAKAGGGLVRGVTDPAKRLLDKAGVSMTIPQMAGGTLRKIEDRVAGLPGVGDIVNASRRKGLEDFQHAAFNEALAPIGQQGVAQIGEQGIGSAQDAISQAYRDALGGIQVRTDAPFKQAMPGVMQQAANAPRVGPELMSGMNEIASPMFGPGGTLRGEDAQSIFQGLEQFKRGYRSGASPDPLYATHIAPAVDAYKGQIEGILQRQAPEVIPALQQANAGNRRVSILGDAVLAAANKGGQFNPAQLMNAIKSNTIKFGGRKSAAAGNGPMFDLARAGNDVLPNTVPDSGTAGRLALYSLLGGAYGAGDYTSKSEDQRGIASSTAKALAAAAAVALGAKGMRPAAQKALFGPRSPAMKKLGQAILDNPNIGSGALIPLLLPQK